MKISIPTLILFLALNFDLKAQKIVSLTDSSDLFTYFNIKKSSTLNLNQQKNTSNEESRIENYNKLKINRFLINNIENLNFSGNLNYKLYINTNNRVDSIVYFQSQYLNTKKGFVNQLVSSLEPKTLDTIFKKMLLATTLKSSKNQAYTILGTLSIPKKSERSLDKIIAAQKKDVKSIDLSNLGLKTFPNQLKKFKNLKEVNLSKNNIEKFKLKRKFRKIENLTLQDNLLGFQSFKIHKKTKLKYLNLSDNFITEIPKINNQIQNLFLARNYISNLEVKNLTNVSLLNLYSNNLKSLPKEINKLQNLKELDLYRNNLSEVPKEIGELKNLETLALSYNNISELPDGLENLTNLKTLYVHHNKLSSLPKLPLGLETLDIGYNKFKTVEKYISAYKNLKVLDYSNNEISGGVAFLLDFPHLKELYINYNDYPENLYELPEESKIFDTLKQRLTYFK